VLAGEVRLSASRRSLAVVVVSAAAIVVVLVSALSNQFVRYQGHPFEEAIMAEAPDARIVFIASTNVADSFPLVTENRLVWASRFPSLWFSPYVATKLDDKSGPSDDIARFVLDATISDLVEFKPDIVFVDQAPTRPAYREAPLDYLVFWDADPRFRGFWKSYEQRGSIGDFGIFVRTVPSPGSELTPGSARDVDRADPFGCILAEVLDSFC